LDHPSLRIAFILLEIKKNPKTHLAAGCGGACLLIPPWGGRGKRIGGVSSPCDSWEILLHKEREKGRERNSEEEGEGGRENRTKN
jgi:hypothetical protein